jgi:hypothetical protein
MLLINSNRSLARCLSSSRTTTSAVVGVVQTLYQGLAKIASTSKVE